MPTITITSPAGSFDAYEAGRGAASRVLFFMDGLGYRPTLWAMADRLAGHGHHVLLPNLYWRAGDVTFDPKSVFSNPAEIDRMRKLLADVVTPDTTRADAAACLAHLGDGKVATIGYCLGGGIAFQTACDFPDRVSAVASFHGGQFIVSPDAPARIAKSLEARAYVGVSEIDRSHTPEITQKLEAAFAEAGVPHQIELYPGVAHGFCVADLPPYNAEAAERHWQRLISFLAV